MSTFNLTLGPSASVTDGDGSAILSPITGAEIKAIGLKPGDEPTAEVEYTDGVLTFTLGIPGVDTSIDYTVPEFTVGTVTTLSYDAQATAQLVKQTDGNYVLNMSIPKGHDGSIPTVNPGTVTSVPAGTEPTVVFNKQDDGSYTVDLTVPQGTSGLTPTLSLGTVETLEAGAQATASLVADTTNPNAYVLNLGLPYGDSTLDVDMKTTFTIGNISTASNESGATVGLTQNKLANTVTFDFVLPPGAVGNDGPPPNISVGEVDTLAAGDSATFGVTKNPDNSYSLNIGIPKGADGVTPQLTLGKVTQLSNGASPTFEIIPAGTTNAYVINVGLVSGKDAITPVFKAGTVTPLESGVAPQFSLGQDATTGNYLINMGIPAGANGKDATIPTFTAGQVTSLKPGSAPTFTLNAPTAASPSYVVDLGVAPGFNGTTPSLKAGTVSMVPYGTAPSFTLVKATDASETYTLNLTLPQGATGDGTKLDQTTVVATTTNPNATLGAAVDKALISLSANTANAVTSATSVVYSGAIDPTTKVQTQSTISVADTISIVSATKDTSSGNATASTQITATPTSLSLQASGGSPLILITDSAPANISETGLTSGSVRVTTDGLYIYGDSQDSSGNDNGRWYHCHTGGVNIPVKASTSALSGVAMAFDPEGGDVCYDVTLEEDMAFTLDNTIVTQGRMQTIYLRIRQPASTAYNYTLPAAGNGLTYVTSSTPSKIAGAIIEARFVTSNNGATVEGYA